MIVILAPNDTILTIVSCPSLIASAWNWHFTGCIPLLIPFCHLFVMFFQFSCWYSRVPTLLLLYIYHHHFDRFYYYYCYHYYCYCIYCYYYHTHYSFLVLLWLLLFVSYKLQPIKRLLEFSLASFPNGTLRFLQGNNGSAEEAANHFRRMLEWYRKAHLFCLQGCVWKFVCPRPMAV